MTDGNEPANPTIRQHDINGNTITFPYYGLTKRELFAAMAMQGLVSNHNTPDYLDDCDDDPNETENPAAIIARLSLEAADALIAALNKDKEQK